MKFLSFVTTLWLISFFGACSLNATTLKDVKTQSQDGVFETHLVFDAPVSQDQASIDFINETVQVNLSDIQVEHPKTVKTKDDNVKSVYTYQADKNSARTRIIYKKGTNASQYQAGTTVEASGNQLIIKINPTIANATKAATENGSSAVSDEDLKAAAAWIEKADKREVSTKKAITTPEKTEVTETKTVLTKENTAGKKESDIPVLADKKVTEEIHKPISSARVVMSLGLVLGLIAGFSFFMKKFLKKTPLKNSQIKVLTQYYMGPKKSLAIVRVAGESILIGVTDHNISLIKTLALLDEEIPQDTPKDFSKSFKDIFSKANREETEAASAAEQEESEDFAFTKIKDAISGRLKNMKEI